MGRKIDSYIDNEGHTVKDGDIVYWNNKDWEVLYISDCYVNLTRNGGMHLPFSCGIPIRKVKNTQGPVRTVTRKEIVPGVYGCVKVHDPGSKFVRINMDDALGVAELRAAAATLIEIADALEDAGK
jgi:hypothetical protein